jgi:hypothetical protein
VSGRHRPGSGRRPVVLLSVATLVGVWLGISAPEVSPVTPPAPVAQSPSAAAGGTPPPTGQVGP